MTFSVVAVKASTLRLTGVLLSDSNANSIRVTSRNGTVVERRAAKWDVNGDGRVNVLDLTRVATRLGRRDASADTNGDGLVNVLDLVLVAQHLGETVGTTPPTVPVTPEPQPTVPQPTVPPTPPVDPYEGMERIPAGEFRMGSNSGRSNEKPVHSVYVDEFYMDTYEVTNAEYAAFLNAKGKHAEAGHTWYRLGETRSRIEYVSRVYRVKAGYENHPVTYVSWYGAMAYAAWKGKRLPTEAEWEKAARGGLAGLTYPWGNSIDRTRANYNQHIVDTTAVGKYPANGYGLYDMSGNVWEWCLDESNAGFYAVSPSQNPISGANSIRWIVDNYTGIKSSRVLRGGSWPNAAAILRGRLSPQRFANGCVSRLRFSLCEVCISLTDFTLTSLSGEVFGPRLFKKIGVVFIRRNSFLILQHKLYKLKFGQYCKFQAALSKGSVVSCSDME